MALRIWLIVAVLLVSSMVQCIDYPIEHVVVMMEENRSFDHIVGWMTRINPEIRGLTGKEFNHVNVSDPKSLEIHVDDATEYQGAFDPDHSIDGTTEGIFGIRDGWNSGEPKMNGFVQANYRNHPTVTKRVMSMFSPTKVPIITTLATEFALFDSWHASVPGPTCPNRYYFDSCSSLGMIDNRAWNLTQDTIYDRFNEVGKPWNLFYSDFPYCSLNFFNLKKPDNMKNIIHISNFFDLAKRGTLPTYSFLTPRGAPTLDMASNDEHPDHDVGLGELLVKQVYEALRASPQWNKTLLIVTYDEHGGFYDHVKPPMKGVPNPDGIIAQNKFDFKMLGVRVPTILVSPWINKGLVIHEPSGPYPTSQYDHTSVAASLKKIFGWSKFLTKRDEWAGTFDHLLLQRTTPRTDCPVTLPPAPPVDPSYVEVEKLKPLNDLQHVILDSVEHALNIAKIDRNMNQGEYGILAEKLMYKIKNRN